MRRRDRLAVLAGALAAVLAAPPGAAAQRVDGRVLDAGSGEPVAGVLVQLIAADSTVLVSAVTEERGAFRLDPRGPAVFLRATRLGYGELRAPIADLAGDGGPIVVRLEPAPVPVAEVTVEATRRNRMLEGQGFYERQRQGIGTFITRDMIETRYPSARRIADILRPLPGLYVREAPGGDVVVFARVALASARGCAPRVYVAGVYVGSVIPVMPPGDVEAIELYRGSASVPSRFGGAEAMCGVVLVWLRSGQS